MCEWTIRLLSLLWYYSGVPSPLGVKGDRILWMALWWHNNQYVLFPSPNTFLRYPSIDSWKSPENVDCRISLFWHWSHYFTCRSSTATTSLFGLSSFTVLSLYHWHLYWVPHPLGPTSNFILVLYKCCRTLLPHFVHLNPLRFLEGVQLTQVIWGLFSAYLCFYLLYH